MKTTPPLFIQIVSLVLFLTACTPAFLLPSQPAGSTTSYHTAPLYAGNYGYYTDSMVTVKLDTPITIDWITTEQIKYGVAVHPFTHLTGGIESDSTYRPPFHIRVICPFLYRSDILESVWLLNDIAKDSTRELDLFESGYSWHRRLWMADHFGGMQYNNRKADITFIPFPPGGINTVDILVYPDHAMRFLNSKLRKVTWKNLNFDYHILVTMIVNTWDAKPARWEPEILIRKIK